MSKRSNHIEPKPAPMPDPDSLEMDDRGTRIYRGPGGDYVTGEPVRRGIPQDGRDDGNYIGDPIEPDDTIRADDEYPQEEWLPASDAPTIIRDLQRDQ
jgi:hypothetical protein